MRCNSRAFTGDNLDNTPLPTGGISIPNSVRKWVLSGTYQHFSDLLHLPFSDLTKSIFAWSYLKSIQITAASLCLPSPKIKTRKTNNFHIAHFVLSIKTNLRKLYKIRNTQNLIIPKQDTLKQLFTGVNRKTFDFLAYRRLLRIFGSCRQC